MLVVETVVHLGQLQFLLELASGGVLVDDGELNTGDACEVFPSLTTDGGGHTGVVRTTGGDPALNGGLQARLRLPDGAGARKLLEGALRLNDVDDVHEQAEAFANVGHGDHDGVLGGLAGEDQADRVGLAADAQRVDLQLRLGDGADGRGNLEHVGAHVELVALGEVVGVVLHEGGATLKAVAHDGADAHEDGGLPVAFSGKAPAVLGREALWANARQLWQSAEVLEIVDAGGAAVGAHHVDHRGLFLGGDEQGVVLGVQQSRVDVVLGLVVLDDLLDLVVLDGVVRSDELVDGPSVDGGAEHALGLGLVALGDGDVTHVVAPAHDLHVVGGIPAGAGAGPGADLLDDLRIGVVADDNLALDAEAGDDVTELTVAVGGLVQVHEVHVDGLPRDFLVVLGGQLQQRLGQHFEAANPHLGRGEGVAPGDDADDVRVGGSLDHELLDTVGGLQGGLEDDLGRNLAGVVQVVNHFSGVNGDLTQGFLAVQVLRTNAEPDFLALEGVFHNHRVTSFTSLFMGVCLSFIRRPRLPSERGAKTPPCWRSQR